MSWPFEHGDLLLAALGGGIIPDLLRFARGRFGNEVPIPRLGIYVLGLICQLAIAALAVLLVEPTTILAALSTGFAGPEIVTRLLATPSSATVASAAAGQPGQHPGLRAWWNS